MSTITNIFKSSLLRVLFSRKWLLQTIETRVADEFELLVEKQRKQDDLAAYRRGVELLAMTNSPQVESNSGVEHAMIVLENLFNKATSEINIFAGNFDNKVCDNEKSNYYQSLKSFLLNGGKVNVVLNDYSPESTNEILKLLKIFSESTIFGSNINVKVTKEKLTDASGKEMHLTTADGVSYREEYDTKNFAAYFSFNRPEKVKELNSKFYSVFNDPSRSKNLDFSLL